MRVLNGFELLESVRRRIQNAGLSMVTVYLQHFDELDQGEYVDSVEITDGEFHVRSVFTHSPRERVGKLQWEGNRFVRQRGMVSDKTVKVRKYPAERLRDLLNYANVSRVADFHELVREYHHA